MDVEAWLEGMGLERYAEAFRAADIDGEVLPELTESDLEKLGVTLGYRKRLLRAIAVLDAADRSAPAGPGAPAVPDARALRPATVMFADLCGFTRLSRELDPESLHALLSAFLAAVDRRIVEHGGWIDKHLGDGVMAVFGAPVAHDNDAERAVRAALAVREAMAPLSAEQGRPLAVHVGIASGQVLAGGTGDAGRSGYTVTGQSVNLASRLSDAARPDEILVSDRVRRVLMDRIEGEDAGALTVEGFAEPVRAWRLSGLRAPAAAPRRPLIGRQGEMAQFEALLAATRRTGSGRVVHLRGEAGIGKSRLLEEWLRLAGEHGFDRHCALVLDLGAGRGRDAVRVLVRGLLGLDRSADAGAIGRAAAAAVAEGLVDADDVVHLNDLLDRPQPPELRALNNAMDNAARRLGKRRTWATLLSRRSARRPQMVAVEDVHWADAVTLDHLSGLAAAVAGCPALLVLTSRLEGDPLDARWRAAAGGTGVSTVDLGPMRPEDGLALARAMGRFDETVIERCLARADGNPLFLEQLLRHAGDAAEPVPGSVQSLTQARLDRLEPADRHALQAASVLGQRFSLDGLRHLIGDTGYDPARLIDRGLLRPHGDGLLFAHALIRDAVYDSLLREMRRGWHRKAADWHGDDDPALRAEHLGRAADPGAPAAHARAAAVETRQLRFERALALCERGLALAAPGRDRTALALMRADLLRELGRPRPSIDAFRACLDETSETPARCRALIGIAAGVRLVGGHAEGMEALAAAEPLAIAEDASLERSQIGYYRGCLLYAAGDVEGCLAQHQGALDQARRAGDPEWQARALSGIGDAYYGAGRFRLSLKHFRHCRALCRRHGFGRIEVGSMHMMGNLRRYLNDLEGAFADLRQAADTADRVGNARTAMVARLILGECLVDRGEAEAALAEIESALAIAEALGNDRFRCYGLYEQARAGWHDPRRRDEAGPWLAEALTLARRGDLGFIGPRLLALLALISGEAAERRAALAEGEDLLGRGAVAHNVLWFRRDAMEACLAAGDPAEALRHGAALEEATRPEPVPWADVFIARARVLAAVAAGRRDAEVVDELRRLRDEARRIGIAAALPALDAALDGSAGGGVAPPGARAR